MAAGLSALDRLRGTTMTRRCHTRALSAKAATNTVSVVRSAGGAHPLRAPRGIAQPRALHRRVDLDGARFW